jgi:hypothetical protein
MDEDLKALLTQLTMALMEHTETLMDQNELLVQIVAQNADLIGAMEPVQEEEAPNLGLNGRPLT